MPICPFPFIVLPLIRADYIAVYTVYNSNQWAKIKIDNPPLSVHSQVRKIQPSKSERTVILRNGPIAFRETLLFAQDISGFRSLTRFRTLGSGTLTCKYRLVQFCSGKNGSQIRPCSTVLAFFGQESISVHAYTAGDSMLHCCDIAVGRKRFGMK